MKGAPAASAPEPRRHPLWPAAPHAMATSTDGELEGVQSNPIPAVPTESTAVCRCYLEKWRRASWEES